MASFHERKAARSDYYHRFVYLWKLRSCSACSGSGHYDAEGSPACAACEGTGNERFKDESMEKLPDGVSTIPVILNNSTASQAQLAARLGINRATLRKYMSDGSGEYHVVIDGRFYSRPGLREIHDTNG